MENDEMARESGKKSVKNKIVSAAWQLFYEKGYNGTTVDDIIELSGTSKGSFYYYFATKDELLNTLSLMLDEYYEELDAKMDPEMNSFDKLLYLNYEVHKWMEENISIEILASLYATQLKAEGRGCLLDQNRTYHKLINRIIEEGQERGQIRTEVPASEVARYYAMCERALVSDCCMNMGAYSLGEYNKKYMPYMLEHYRGTEK
jgi:AcrR family transcriptional regulator